MEADRFDALARSLTNPRSRRGALGGLLLGTLGLLGVRSEEVAAHNPKAKCKKKSGKAKQKCVKKAKKHNAAHANETPPLPPLECLTVANCPVPTAPHPCFQATCIAGRCGIGPRAAGAVCRAAAGECDVAEVCDGISLDCPADRFKPAGAPCTDDGIICTQDVCDGAGRCTHPGQPPLTPCGTGRVCCTPGTCCPPNETCQGGTRCCRPQRQPCNDPGECCSGGCVFDTCV